MRLIIPMILAAAVTAIVAYLLAPHVFQEAAPTKSCMEINASEIDSLIGTFMEEEGHPNYIVENVSPVYCGSGYSTYNVNSDIILRPGDPMQTMRNMRLQIRLDSSGTKVYEVLLSNPSKELLR